MKVTPQAVGPRPLRGAIKGRVCSQSVSRRAHLVGCRQSSPSSQDPHSQSVQPHRWRSLQSVWGHQILPWHRLQTVPHLLHTCPPVGLLWSSRNCSRNCNALTVKTTDCFRRGRRLASCTHDARHPSSVESPKITIQAHHMLGKLERLQSSRVSGVGRIRISEIWHSSWWVLPWWEKGSFGFGSCPFHILSNLSQSLSQGAHRFSTKYLSNCGNPLFVTKDCNVNTNIKWREADRNDGLPLL